VRRRAFLAAAAGLAAALAGGGARSAAARPALDAARFAALRRHVRTPYGEIAYVELGRGPAALFLHGFPLNGFQWRGAIERLSAHRRCIAPDFLGLGHTRVADLRRIDPEAQAAMLAALLDRLGIGQADLVANDSGGAVAQLLLVRHPQRVRTLLLTNCDTEIDSPPPALLPVIELARQGRFADAWLAPWRADPVRARSAEGIGGMCYADPTQPTDEAIEAYFAPLLASARSRAGLHAYALALERNALAGTAAALKRSTAPVRIVWGDADTIFSAKSPDYLDRTFGASRGVRRLEGSKLFWPEERPDVVAEEALRLWQADARRPARTWT